MPVLDPIAGLIVAGMIMKTGFSIGKENVYEITDSNDLDVIPKINDVCIVIYIYIYIYYSKRCN